jgi:hypothetical protein
MKNRKARELYEFRSVLSASACALQAEAPQQQPTNVSQQSQTRPSVKKEGCAVGAHSRRSLRTSDVTGPTTAAISER